MASTSIGLSSQVETSRNWLELPPDLLTSIFMRVGSVDLITARKVCKTWRAICSNPAMWRVVDIRYVDNFYLLYNDTEADYCSKLEGAAKQAVDLSCGQMIDLTIEHFGSDNLLPYVSDRSCQLRRLRLVSCSSITDEGLSEMVSKLALLEELHLFQIYISKQAIEVVGRCCPQLKSFSLSRPDFCCPYDGWNEEALAIAENLPGLRHVQLIGNWMTSLGLLAILENCLHLESLDMRQCFNVANLGLDLERRLFQQIKNIKLPYDSTEDYEFGVEIFVSSDEDFPSQLSVMSGGSDADSDKLNVDDI